MTEEKNVEEEVQEEKEQEGPTPEQRVQAANAEVRTVMEKYNVDFDVYVLLRAGMVVPQLRIVPVELMQEMTRPPQPAVPPAQGMPIPNVASTVAK